MTKLSAIRNNHLSLTCWCGHHALVPIEAFIKAFGGDASVHQVVKQARCTWCQCKILARVQIVFVGKSDFAMRGADNTHIESGGIKTNKNRED